MGKHIFRIIATVFYYYVANFSLSQLGKNL